MKMNLKAPPHQAAQIFILLTIFLDVLSANIIFPVLPKLLEGFLDGDPVRVATTFGVFGVAGGLTQFICAPLLGSLSDRFGRRSIILFACFGMSVDFVVMALAPNLAWLFIGRIVSSVTGSSVGTAFAYIADVTPPEKRAASFGTASVAFSLGLILGPALGGVLGGVDAHLPFWVAACMSLLNALYGLFVLPESLPRDKRSRFSWKRANPVGALLLLRSHTELAGLASVMFLMSLADQVFPSTAVLYMNYRFGWGATTIGLTLMGVGICIAIVQGGIVKPVLKRLGERRTLIVGLFFAIVGLCTHGLAQVPVVFWMGVPIMALSGLTHPAIQGLMTSRVSASEQGQLQGAMMSMVGIASMMGPALFSQTYAYFIGSQAAWHLPGAAFLLAALIIFAAMLVAWRRTLPAIPQSPSLAST